MTRTQSKGRTPLDVPSDHHLTTRLWQYAERSAGQEAVRYWVDGSWHPLTWGELADRVRAVAAGLIARGVEPGDRVVVRGVQKVRNGQPVTPFGGDATGRPPGANRRGPPRTGPAGG